MSKQRLDNLLVSRGLAVNKSKAHALIMAGEVTVSGKVITKAGSLVDEDAAIELARKPPFVSRGGIKLAHALDEFKLDVTSLIAMDIGASTGGFTDCLLQRGAGKVYLAVKVEFIRFECDFFFIHLFFNFTPQLSCPPLRKGEVQG
jgi:23S rRNA (cytidine1920-2'-O)/16S rRNA (cytidine1409-2'-O)-methyltransferase